ncbi:transposase domain-containing protein [Streptomyces sp. NPDC057910]|uniref:transposase domain-containing protein n=1 Tax=Streptomyces sp. NPDC057910 TaxID=3346278 RepID=UPI0036E72C1A
MCDDLRVEQAEGGAAGRLTDGVSIGLLATVFPEEAVQAAVDEAGAREERTRSLPAKLMMHRTPNHETTPPELPDPQFNRPRHPPRHPHHRAPPADSRHT